MTPIRVALAVPAFATAAWGGEKADFLKKLEGEWSCQSEWVGNESFAPGTHKTWKVAGKTISVNGGDPRDLEVAIPEKGPVRLRVGKPTEPARLFSTAAIAKIDGDELVVCFGAEGEFPKDFDSARAMLLRFKRK